MGILARGPPLGKAQRGRPVRGSTVEGVIGWPAGGVGRGGPVWGTGGGAGSGAVGVVNTPGDDEGSPLRGLIGVWLLGNPVRAPGWAWLPGSPVRGSTVDGAPTGGLGVIVGDDGDPVAGGELDGGAGRGDELLPVCARAGATVSSTAASAAVRMRACVMANLLASSPEGRRA